MACVALTMLPIKAPASRLLPRASSNTCQDLASALVSMRTDTETRQHLLAFLQIQSIEDYRAEYGPFAKTITALMTHMNSDSRASKYPRNQILMRLLPEQKMKKFVKVHRQIDKRFIREAWPAFKYKGEAPNSKLIKLVAHAPKF